MSKTRTLANHQNERDRLQGLRDAVLLEHAKKIADKAAIRHPLGRRSKRKSRAPPCMQPLEHLKAIHLNELRLQDKPPGTVLIVRAVGQPQQPRPLLPILNVIEDDTVEAMHIEVYFPSTSPPIAILASGNILAIKTPECEMGSHGPVIKVVHPSDILILQPSHKLVPKAFLDLSGLSVNSVRDWIEDAKVALEKGEYTRTIATCSNVFEQFSHTEDAVDILKTLHQCRSVAAMCAGYYDLATADALAFISGCTDERLKDDSKFLHQAARAAYKKQDYSLAQNLLQRLLKLNPKNILAVIMCNNTRLRLLEERDGIYDFAAMAKKQLPIYHASFTNLTEIRASCGRGRGLFAKVYIPRGGLVLCEKAFASAEEAKAAKTTKNNAYSGDDQDAQMWLYAVQKAFKNPSQAQRLLGLYGGSAYSTQTNVPTVDGQSVVDVYQIKEIVSYNTFAHHAKVDSGQSLFIRASYANHSCIDNTYRNFVGDMIVLRAVNDIAAGTEITTSYWPAALEEPNRHETLSKYWKFVCECKLCESELQCDQDWEELFKVVKKLLKERYSGKKEFIVKIEQLVKRLESVYPCHLFEDLPRIAMQDLQSKLLKLWVALNDRDKIRKHATALLREYGFRVEITNDKPKIQLKGPNGLLHEPVVNALYQLGRVSADEDGKEYLALSKTMWLAMNGTSEEWEAWIA